MRIFICQYIFLYPNEKMVSSLTKVTTVTSSIIKGIQKWKVNSYLFIYFFEKEVKTNFNIPGKPDSRLSQPSLLD